MVELSKEVVIQKLNVEIDQQNELNAHKFAGSWSRKEAVRSLRDCFRELSNDPVVKRLRALCKATGYCIPCTSSRFIDGGGIPGSDAYPATEQAVVLTGDGFRIGAREVPIDRWAASAYRERIAPFNRLVFFPLRTVAASGTTPESVKTHLHNVADDVASGTPLWVAASKYVKAAHDLLR